MSVLIVEPVLDELLRLMSTLTGVGFEVTAAETFAEAKPLLHTQPPSLLFTAVRLGVYNGLHLVLRGKSLRPEMAAVVTSPTADPVLQADAEAMGATFIVNPLPASDCIAAVLQTLFRVDQSGGPIRPPYERRRQNGVASAVPGTPARGVERRRHLPWLRMAGSSSPRNTQQ